MIDDHSLSVVKTLPGVPRKGEAFLHRDESLWLARRDREITTLGKIYLCLTVGMGEESVIPLCVPVCASILRSYYFCKIRGKNNEGE